MSLAREKKGIGFFLFSFENDFGYGNDSGLGFDVMALSSMIQQFGTIGFKTISTHSLFFTLVYCVFFPLIYLQVNKLYLLNWQGWMPFGINTLHLTYHILRHLQQALPQDYQYCNFSVLIQSYSSFKVHLEVFLTT